MIIFSSCILESVYGKIGAGLYLQVYGTGSIDIQYLIFQNITSSPEPTDLSVGGALYIDGTKSNLTLTLDTVLMYNCKARLSGGCIYLDTFYYTTKVSIASSKFINCLSLSSTFISLKFLETAQE
jgi:hypothetical protein